VLTLACIGLLPADIVLWLTNIIQQMQYVDLRFQHMTESVNYSYATKVHLV